MAGCTMVISMNLEWLLPGSRSMDHIASVEEI